MNNDPAGPSSLNQKFSSPDIRNKNVKFQMPESDQDMIGRLRILREEYAKDGQGDPEFYTQLDELENHLLNKKPK